MRTVLRMLIAAALSLSVPAAAQSSAGASRAPALVAIYPELQGQEVPFRIARFAGNSGRDVILLAPDADAAALTLAVEALLAARRQTGDAASSDAMLRMRPRGAAGAQRPRTVLPWAARVLADVRAAAPRQVPGLGRLRAVQIWLPAQLRARA